jgi:FtsP/CotA-like multicopper oxidase with cupredoxin domain
MSNAMRAVIAALVVVAAIVAFVLLRPNEGESGGPTGTEAAPSGERAGSSPGKRPAPPSYTRITIKDGSPVGGPQTVEVKKGDRVRLEFHSDAKGEVHIHGYDKELELKPGKPARVGFPATLEGVFEVESHTSGQQLAKLKVEP